MSGRTQKLNLYLDDDAKAVIFEIKANANDATFQYTGKALKMDGDLQYKNGALYTSVATQFSTVIASVVSENSRALSAEGVIATSVNTEKNRAEGAELVLRQDLASEVARANGIDTSFQTTLATETASRISADSKLTTDLSFEVSRAQANETVITGLVSAETASRISDVSALNTRVGAEEAKRLLDDATEYNRAFGAEFVLDTKIAGEVVNRTTAISALSATTVSNLSAEAKLRSDADIALTARVDFITVNLDSKKMDSLSEIVNKVNSVGVDVYTRLARIEEVLLQLRGSSIYSAAQAEYVAGVPAAL